EGELGLGRLQQSQHLLGAPRQLHPGVGEHHPPAHLLEEGDLRLPLELRELLGHRRRRHRMSARDRRHRLQPAQFVQQEQAMQVQHGDLLRSCSSASRYRWGTFAGPGMRVVGTVGDVTTSSAPASPTTAPAPSGRASGVSLTPVLFILASCFSLQFGAALATQLFPEIGSWGTTALRLGIAALVLLIVVRPKVHRFTRQQWIAVAAFGVAIGGMNGAFYAAIDRIPLGTAAAIGVLRPLTVAAVLSTRRPHLPWLLLGLARVGLLGSEHFAAGAAVDPSGRRVRRALAGVGLFGVESFTGVASLDPIGVLFALVAAVFWGLYVLSSARVGQLVPGQDGLAVAMAIGALAILPLGAQGAVAGVMDLRLL